MTKTYWPAISTFTMLLHNRVYWLNDISRRRGYIFFSGLHDVKVFMNVQNRTNKQLYELRVGDLNIRLY